MKFKSKLEVAAEELVAAKEAAIQVIAKDETSIHKHSCPGFQAAHDVLVFLIKHHGFDLDTDYSGDGRSVRDILGEDLCSLLEKQASE